MSIVQHFSWHGRVGLAAILLPVTVLIASCGSSGQQTSSGLVSPVSCPSASACLGIAEAKGFQGHVLVPVHSVAAGKSYYFAPSGAEGWGFDLVYRDVPTNQVFVESIGTKGSIVYPCLVKLHQTQVTLPQNGRVVCVEMTNAGERVRFYSSGNFYQLHAAGLSKMSPSDQEAVLLGIAAKLS